MPTQSNSLTAPLLAIRRHRLALDGRGVVTLVAFMGCPLKCKYCLNESCHDVSNTPRRITPQQLLDEVKVDNLYFLATDGGVTFGGGEPLLQSKFIEQFCKLADSRWTISLETSLNVPREHLERVLPYVDKYIIDVKDMNTDVYERYTQHPQADVIANLRWLMDKVDNADRVEVRLPHIPEFNIQEDVDSSRSMLEKLGIRNFDEFDYVVR